MRRELFRGSGAWIPIPEGRSPMPQTALLNEIRRWFAYTRWANDHMLDACETVDPTALSRDVGASFGSLHGTLEHLYSADWVWLERFQGRNPSSWPARGTLKTVGNFREAWASLAVERARFVDALDARRLGEPFAYRNLKGEAFSYPLGDLLRHVSNHATYHRGQVMQMVRQLGGTARSTDYVLWLREGA